MLQYHEINISSYAESIAITDRFRDNFNHFENQNQNRICSLKMWVWHLNGFQIVLKFITQNQSIVNLLFVDMQFITRRYSGKGRCSRRT